MKKLLVAILLAGACFAQTTNTFPAFQHFPGAPVNPCQATFLAQNDATDGVFTCDVNTLQWVQIGTPVVSGAASPGTALPVKFTLVFAGNGNGPTTVGDANQPVITGTQSNFTPTATEPAGRNLFTGAGASVNVTAGYEQGFGANPGQGNYTYGTVSRYSTRLKLFGNTNVRYWIGISDGQAADLNGASATWATDTPNRYYCAFRFSSTTDTTIKATCGTDNTHQTVADTTVAVDTTNSQLFEIVPTANGFQFYINGVLRNTITTNIPTLVSTLGSLWTVDNKNTANNVGGAIMWSMLLLNK